MGPHIGKIGKIREDDDQPLESDNLDWDFPGVKIMQFWQSDRLELRNTLMFDHPTLRVITDLVPC